MNNVIVKSYRSVKFLQNAVKQLVTGGGNFFLSYDYLLLAERIYRFDADRLKCPQLIYYQFEFKKHICIAPLLIYKEHIKFFNAKLIGADMDFIYNDDCPAELIEYAIDYLRNNYKKKSISFVSMSGTSKILDVLKKIDGFETGQTNCFQLVGCTNFEEYFSSLSKHTRQNIRTAKNRITKSGINEDFIIYNKTNPLPLFESLKLWSIYFDRKNDWGYNYGKMSKWLHVFFYMLTSAEIVSMKHMTNSGYFVLYMNDDIAAFLFGYYYNNKLVVPQLAINSKYSKYSPGGLLLMNVMKWGKEKDCNFTIDLSRGNEPYKKVYGGEPRPNFSVTIPPLIQTKQ